MSGEAPERVCRETIKPLLGKKQLVAIISLPPCHRAPITYSGGVYCIRAGMLLASPGGPVTPDKTWM